MKIDLTKLDMNNCCLKNLNLFKNSTLFKYKTSKKLKTTKTTIVSYLILFSAILLMNLVEAIIDLPFCTKTQVINNIKKLKEINLPIFLFKKKEIVF